VRFFGKNLRKSYFSEKLTNVQSSFIYQIVAFLKLYNKGSYEFQRTLLSLRDIEQNVVACRPRRPSWILEPLNKMPDWLQDVWGSLWSP